MTLPAAISSSIFVDGELTNEVKWYTRIFTVINQLITYNGTFNPVLASVTTVNPATSAGAVETLHANLALSFTATATGVYAIEYGWKWVTSVAGDTAWGGIHASQSAITVASPIVSAVQTNVPAIGGAMNENTYRWPLWSPGVAGTWNLQAGVKRVAGTGNSQITGGNQNAFLAVIQLKP